MIFNVIILCILSLTTCQALKCITCENSECESGNYNTTVCGPGQVCEIAWTFLGNISRGCVNQVNSLGFSSDYRKKIKWSQYGGKFKRSYYTCDKDLCNNKEICTAIFDQNNKNTLWNNKCFQCTGDDCAKLDTNYLNTCNNSIEDPICLLIFSSRPNATKLERKCEDIGQASDTEFLSYSTKGGRNLVFTYSCKINEGCNDAEYKCFKVGDRQTSSSNTIKASIVFMLTLFLVY
uniref:Sodefrin-like factor n=1 Tax=Acrobeloides nanus TaxID=290746 RepID=A0A914CQB1_9BILA